MKANRFDPARTYRFFIIFNDEGTNVPQTEIKHFSIVIRDDDYERYLHLDDHAEDAWTKHWRRTAWWYGQLGLCTNPHQGIFGFDTSEINHPRKRKSIMKSWQRFHRRHGFEVGVIESMSHPSDKEIDYDGQAFRSRA